MVHRVIRSLADNVPEHFGVVRPFGNIDFAPLLFLAVNMHVVHVRECDTTFYRDGFLVEASASVQVLIVVQRRVFGTRWEELHDDCVRHKLSGRCDVK